MNFPWSKTQHRRELLAQPFPVSWLGYLAANVAQYRSLSNDEQRKLGDIARILVAEKSWEGCGGLALTDEMQVTIAAQAALLVLGFEDEYYPNVETILVYPGSFQVLTRRSEVHGVVDERVQIRAGQAALRGPVIVSWSAVRRGGTEAGDGYNVVLHEFAHTLDMRDGAADGAPYLEDAGQIEAWARVMGAEYQRLVEAVAAEEPTLLRAYGATNAAEFFAVATECFFELPRRMQDEHPELYQVLRDFYHQDPAARR